MIADRNFLVDALAQIPAWATPAAFPVWLGGAALAAIYLHHRLSEDPEGLEGLARVLELDGQPEEARRLRERARG